MPSITLCQTNTKMFVFNTMLTPCHAPAMPRPRLARLRRKKVARKLVLMEQDLERSEEKVELSERFVHTAKLPHLQPSIRCLSSVY